jgi:hypothetical protein
MTTRAIILSAGLTVAALAVIFFTSHPAPKPVPEPPVTKAAAPPPVDCHDAIGRHLEYMVVNSYFGTWSLHELGLTRQDLRQAAGGSIYWEERLRNAPDSYIESFLTGVLKDKTGLDYTGCRWSEPTPALRPTLKELGTK